MPQIVLFQPQIPPNTGNIARTCAATNTPLHLIKPLGFDISDRHLKRAGLDYWPQVNLQCHDSWTTFGLYQKNHGGRLIAFTTGGQHNYIDFQFHPQDWLLFGRETSGLPPEVLHECDDRVYIPIHQTAVRSLNLSVSVAIALFEAQRQLGWLDRCPPPRPQTEDHHPGP